MKNLDTKLLNLLSAHPFPTHKEKSFLCLEHGLTLKQLNQTLNHLRYKLRFNQNKTQISLPHFSRKILIKELRMQYQNKLLELNRNQSSQDLYQNLNQNIGLGVQNTARNHSQSKESDIQKIPIEPKGNMAHNIIESFSREEIHSLSKKYLLSKSHIKQLLKHISWYQKNVNEESKQYIISFCTKKFKDKIIQNTLSNRYQATTLCNEIIEQANKEMILNPNEAKFHPLASLSRKQIKDLIIYYYIDKRVKHTSKKESQFIKEWMNNRRHRAVSSQEIQHLMNTLDISYSQVLNLIRKSRDPNGEITQEKKASIYSYIQNQPIENINIDNIRILSRRHELSTRQVIGIISRMLDPSGILTDEKFHLIQNMYHQYGKSYILYNINELREQFELSRIQIYTILKKISNKNKKLKKQYKLLVSQRLKSLQDENKQWQKEDTEYFMNTYNLTRDQMRYILNYLQDSRRPITHEKKKQLMKWMDENPNIKSLSNKEAKQLQKQIDLSVSQITKLFYNSKRRPISYPASTRLLVADFIRNKKNEINKESLDSSNSLTELKSLPEINDNLNSKKLKSYLNDESLNYLQKKTGLTRKQLYSMIKNFEIERNTISEEKRNLIIQWIKNNPNGQDVDDSQIQKLSEETELHPIRLRQWIWYLRDTLKKGQITIEKRNQINEWMKQHQMKKPTGADIQLLAKKLELSRTQIRQIATRILDPPKPLENAFERVSLWVQEHGIPESKHEWNELHNVSQVSRQQMHELIRKLKKKLSFHLTSTRFNSQRHQIENDLIEN